MKLNATVSINTSITDVFSIYELEKHFADYDVAFRGTNYGLKLSTKNIGISLSGTKDNIRKSIKELYQVAKQRVNGIETNPARHVPEKLKQQLECLLDEDKYRNLYDFCVAEYLQDCKSSHNEPHPEVRENLTHQ